MIPIQLPPQPIPNQPRLWLTSMSGSPSAENAIEMIEPLLPYLDGVIWVLNDQPADCPAARYLESVKGAGRVIHRPYVPRHDHMMNEALFCGVMDEDDLVLYCDDLERPMVPFVSRVKSEIGPMMNEANVDVIFAWSKPFLFRYHETLEYRNSPHWGLHGWNERGIEWATIEADETKVRFNVRPQKRAAEPNHWCAHYLRYMLFPAGCNHAALGIEQYAQPGEAPQAAFQRREQNRLAFRREMKRRGFERTVEGFVAMCRAGLDDGLKAWLRSDKVFSDAFHWLVMGNTAVRDTHRPVDALPIL